MCRSPLPGTRLPRQLLETCPAGQHPSDRRSGAQSCAQDPEDAGGAWRPPVRVLFKARAVVSSAGTLHTPALLLRSRIRARGNVGRHLRLHPATVSIGYFDGANGAPRRPPQRCRRCGLCGLRGTWRRSPPEVAWVRCGTLATVRRCSRRPARRTRAARGQAVRSAPVWVSLSFSTL